MHALALIPHIVGGSIALGTGAAAFCFRKGGRLHGQAGTVFFASMLVMLSTAAALAAFGSSRFVAVNAIFTIYLVMTSWATARRRDGKAGRFERFALAIPLGCAAADLIFGLEAINSPAGRLDGFAASGYFGFVAFAGLAAGLDLNFILRRRLSWANRIARHLWRMCVPLSMAAGSLFLGQQQIFPEGVRGSSVMFVPTLAPLALMAFWLLHFRSTGAPLTVRRTGQTLVGRRSSPP